MMNEPVAERTATTPAQATAAAATTIQAPGSMANIMQSGAGMLQQLQNMPPEARAQMASDMGMNLEQLQQVRNEEQDNDRIYIYIRIEILARTFPYLRSLS